MTKPGDRPPLDAEVSSAIDGAWPPAEITPESLAEARKVTLQFSPTDADLRRGGAFAIEERCVPGPPGAPDISLLICRPKTAVLPAPAIYHTHGGGFTTGNNRSAIGPILDWALEFGAVVVSVEYRLAPEHPDPAPIADCYSGLLWMAHHANELGIDSGRLLVAGASAGGGLAASMALMARDLGGPALLGQVLIYPFFDDQYAGTWSDEGTGWQFDRNMARNCWTMLFGERVRGPNVSIYSAPARAIDLSRLPPAFIDVGSADLLRDPAVAYANRIWHAGGAAELHVWSGGIHGFDLWAPDSAVAKAMMATRAHWVRRLLTSGSG